jgi:hypothetical protein
MNATDMAEGICEREPASPLTEDELRERLVEQMNAMARDADKRDMLPVFVQVATWKLAAIGHRCGPIATGDILRQLGWQLTAMEERAQAQREADEARAQGRMPH